MEYEISTQFKTSDTVEAALRHVVEIQVNHAIKGVIQGANLEIALIMQQSVVENDMKATLGQVILPYELSIHNLLARENAIPNLPVRSVLKEGTGNGRLKFRKEQGVKVADIVGSMTLHITFNVPIACTVDQVLTASTSFIADAVVQGLMGTLRRHFFQNVEDN